jgi:protein-S-isoprenylcysteine O-methyltransferase Ste14
MSFFDGNFLLGLHRCFHALGTLFTFEISIQSSHSLITSGPYAWVRHPSYTGVYLTLLSSSFLWTAPHGWLREYGLRAREMGALSSLTALFLVFWTVKCAFAAVGTRKRIGIEDRALRGQFGKEWDEWRRRVPCVLVPGVI